MEKTKVAVLDYLNELGEFEKRCIHNDYCQSTNDFENEIYENDEEFFETYFGENTMSAVRAAVYGDYNYTDEYVRFNGMGNLETLNDLEDVIDLEAIAEDILENPDNYYDIEFEENE